MSFTKSKLVHACRNYSLPKSARFLRHNVVTDKTLHGVNIMAYDEQVLHQVGNLSCAHEHIALYE